MAANPSSDILEIDLNSIKQPSTPPSASPPKQSSTLQTTLPTFQSDLTNLAQATPNVPTIPVDSPSVAEDSTASPRAVRHILKDVLETAVLTIAVFLLVRSAVQSYRISGTSMVPNFEHEQFLVVNKLAYYLDDPQRGDVIVFNYPDGTERDFIKRVIGVPGDTVEIREGKIYINGLYAMEPYDFIPFNYDAAPTLVGKDKLYVLGDNRSDSEDSHLWGLLDQSHIVGKVWISLWPLNTLGSIDHEALSIQLPINP